MHSFERAQQHPMNQDPRASLELTLEPKPPRAGVAAGDAASVASGQGSMVVPADVGRFTLRNDEAFADLPLPPYMRAAGSPWLDLSTSLEECGSIRVALLPVGGIDAATFRRYARLCAAHASQLQLFEITHGQALCLCTTDG